ncbi:MULTISPECIES: GAF domain-containing protein [Sphingomonas]|uniref:GAF domain-containing protein n=1 Tax=Sphingomonas aerolata TaxID=185951 RepID=UPI002D78FF76|nr:GAF domain-containing protein [Sphingomonas sp. STIS6.2]
MQRHPRVRQCGSDRRRLRDPRWNSHPAPALYGFKSYVSLPIILSDGTFFGTLCAIDPHPRKLRGRTWYRRSSNSRTASRA